MLRRSIIGPKTDMTIAIASWRGPEDTVRVVAEVRAAASEIQTLTADRFASMVRMLLTARAPERAQHLVDVLSDTEPTRLGLLLLRLVSLTIVAGFAALILLAVR